MLAYDSTKEIIVSLISVLFKIQIIRQSKTIKLSISFPPNVMFPSC